MGHALKPGLTNKHRISIGLAYVADFYINSVIEEHPLANAAVLEPYRDAGTDSRPLIGVAAFPRTPHSSAGNLPTLIGRPIFSVPSNEYISGAL